MSRIDRIFARRTEAPRVVRKSQKLRRRVEYVPGVGVKVDYVRPPHHVTGDQWWRTRMADLVERKRGDATIRKAA